MNATRLPSTLTGAPLALRARELPLQRRRCQSVRLERRRHLGHQLAQLTHRPRVRDAVSQHPGLCRAVESLLGEVAGTRVTSVCDHSARPRCAFEVQVPA